jgi:hypothetical protein
MQSHFGYHKYSNIFLAMLHAATFQAFTLEALMIIKRLVPFVLKWFGASTLVHGLSWCFA